MREVSAWVPKGSNSGSERVKLWFRKGQTGFAKIGFLVGQTFRFPIGQANVTVTHGIITGQAPPERFLHPRLF